MTKNILLAAASAAALLAAGAATAGDISGTIGSTVEVAYDVDTPYTIATEADVAESLSGAFTAVNQLGENALTVVEGTTQNYVVTFTLTGGEFDGAFTAAAQDDEGSAIGSGVTFAAAGSTATTRVYVATVTADGVTGDITVGGFGISGGDLTIDSQTDVTVASTVQLLAGGSTFTVDTAPAVTAVDFDSAVGAVTIDDTNTLIADLPDFTDFQGLGLTGTLASDFSVAFNSGTYVDLDGTAADELSDVVDGITVTITGPNLGGLEPTLSGGSLNEDSTATSSIFDFADANDLEGADFVVTASGDDEITAGSFSAVVAMDLANGSTRTSSALAAGAITLDGINFVAPWVSGSGASTSVIRIGNSDADTSGPVTVRMISAVVNGTTVYESEAGPLELSGVPGGGDLQITSADLVAHFGAFQRGDFRITVQSDSQALSAKMRSTRNGQTFEQSLGGISQGVVEGSMILVG